MSGPASNSPLNTTLPCISWALAIARQSNASVKVSSPILNGVSPVYILEARHGAGDADVEAAADLGVDAAGQWVGQDVSLKCRGGVVRKSNFEILYFAGCLCSPHCILPRVAGKIARFKVEIAKVAQAHQEFLGRRAQMGDVDFGGFTVESVEADDLLDLSIGQRTVGIADF